MDWTAGYASDIEYTAGFYREQSPTYLNLVCVLNGLEPVPIDQSFTYCELGFGRGLTVSMLAAANPKGKFYATDFNPGHVAGARELAAQAQLSNLTLLEDSFDELAAGKHADLPQFDFITLHGIYTWVTRENRGHIVTFIKRYLKPGGLVYLSYNAQPGWTAALPLQRLLVEFGDAFPNRSDLQVKGASELIARMGAAGAGYLTSNPGLSKWLDVIKTGNVNYLVHEYMHKHWEPLYHADVARDLAEAKLDFAGSADLALTYPAVFLGKEKLAIIETMANSSMQETMQDYFLNTSFRKDVFVRGKRQLKPMRKVELLQQFGIALIVPRSTVSTELKLSFGMVNGKETIYVPILDALAARPHTIAELQALPALADVLIGDIAQAAAYLCAAGKTEAYWKSGVQQELAPAHRMNAATSARARHADELQALCSPILGSGIVVGLIERLVFHHLTTSGAEASHADIVNVVYKMLRAQGRSMNKDGVAVTSEAENLEQIGRLVTKIFTDDLPLWRRLGML